MQYNRCITPRARLAMIPFDGAFEILADLSPSFRTRLECAAPKHRKPLQSMLDHSLRPRITDPTKATSAAVQAMPRNPQPNQHFGWLCVDTKSNRLVVAFRGTEFFKDWLDDFDFTPEPYSSISRTRRRSSGFSDCVRSGARKPAQSGSVQSRQLQGTFDHRS